MFFSVLTLELPSYGGDINMRGSPRIGVRSLLRLKSVYVGTCDIHFFVGRPAELVNIQMKIDISATLLEHEEEKLTKFEEFWQKFYELIDQTTKTLDLCRSGRIC